MNSANLVTFGNLAFFPAEHESATNAALLLEAIGDFRPARLALELPEQFSPADLAPHWRLTGPPRLLALAYGARAAWRWQLPAKVRLLTHGLPVFTADCVRFLFLSLHDSICLALAVAEARVRVGGWPRHPIPCHFIDRAFHGMQQAAVLPIDRQDLVVNQLEDYQQKRLGTVGFIDLHRSIFEMPSDEEISSREAAMAARLEALGRRHPDERILVVVGAAHVRRLESLLRASEAGARLPAPTLAALGKGQVFAFDMTLADSYRQGAYGSRGAIPWLAGQFVQAVLHGRGAGWDARQAFRSFQLAVLARARRQRVLPRPSLRRFVLFSERLADELLRTCRFVPSFDDAIAVAQECFGHDHARILTEMGLQGGSPKWHRPPTREDLAVIDMVAGRMLIRNAVQAILVDQSAVLREVENLPSPLPYEPELTIEQQRDLDGGSANRHLPEELEFLRHQIKRAVDVALGPGAAADAFDCHPLVSGLRDGLDLPGTLAALARGDQRPVIRERYASEDWPTAGDGTVAHGKATREEPCPAVVVWEMDDRWLVDSVSEFAPDPADAGIAFFTGFYFFDRRSQLGKTPIVRQRNAFLVNLVRSTPLGRSKSMVSELASAIAAIPEGLKCHQSILSDPDLRGFRRPRVGLCLAAAVKHAVAGRCVLIAEQPETVLAKVGNVCAFARRRGVEIVPVRSYDVYTPEVWARMREDWTLPGRSPIAEVFPWAVEMARRAGAGLPQ